MKFVISLAFKNLTRYKRRTLITAGAIAFGIMMFIMVDSMLGGAEYESVRNLKWYETASVRIYNEGYWEERHQTPLDINIPEGASVVKKLEESGYTASARTVFSGDMILNAEDFGEDGNLSVQVTAIDTAKDYDVFHYGDTLVDGRFLEPNEEAVLLGSWLAEDIGAEVGYWITIITRGNGGFYEAMDLEIAGIVNCPNPNVNRTLIMMPIETADYYLAMEGAATEINIKLPDNADVEAEAAEIQKTINSFDSSVKLRALDWKYMASDYLAMVEAKRGGTGIVLFLIFIIAAVGISNTMLMAIYERIRELGMMRSLGMSDGKIRASFVIEAAGIGLIGSILGVILGILANLYVIYIGFDLGFFMRDMDIGFRIQSVMRGIWNIDTIAGAFFAGTLISTLVAFIPTGRALKMDIPSCLRHQ
ncbi:MAG: ABC transporter permease [Spirochaetales bacterium]|uniref:ABC transporter permease n=1 Tax=Candidatus Thalassospirochaeta sargassi TaxID=3119039 RepID=A0AAJ1IED6_9SPIO|nr:ABC transporter permease [Spirochaetales bacterium]